MNPFLRSEGEGDYDSLLQERKTAALRETVAEPAKAGVCGQFGGGAVPVITTMADAD